MSLGWFEIEMIFPVTNEYYPKEDTDEVLANIRLKEAGSDKYEKGTCYINLSTEATIKRIEPALYVKDKKKVHYSIMVFGESDTIAIPLKSTEVYQMLSKYVSNLPEPDTLK